MQRDTPLERDVQLNFRGTADEKKEIAYAAKASGISISEYLRRSVFNRTDWENEVLTTALRMHDRFVNEKRKNVTLREQVKHLEQRLKYFGQEASAMLSAMAQLRMAARGDPREWATMTEAEMIAERKATVRDFEKGVARAKKANAAADAVTAGLYQMAAGSA